MLALKWAVLFITRKMEDSKMGFFVKAFFILGTIFFVIKLADIVLGFRCQYKIHGLAVGDAWWCF